MFGIKIIKKSEYYELKEVAEQFETRHREQAIHEQVKKDNESLREQNSELRMKLNNLDATGLKDLVILKSESCKCDKCNFGNSDDCQKLIFSDRTICVTNKNNVNCFKSKKK